MSEQLLNCDACSANKPVEVHGDRADGDENDEHLNPVPERLDVLHTLPEDGASFLDDKEEDEEEVCDLARDLEDEGLLVVAEQVHRFDAVVRRQPAAVEHFRHHRHDAEQVDVGVVDGELDEDGARPTVCPLVRLHVGQLLRNAASAAAQLDHVAAAVIDGMTRPERVRVETVAAAVPESIDCVVVDVVLCVGGVSLRSR